VANVPTVEAKAEQKAEAKAAVNVAKVDVNVASVANPTPNAPKAKTCRPKKVPHKKLRPKTVKLRATKAKHLNAANVVRATVTAVIAVIVSLSNAATQQAKRLLQPTMRPNRHCMTAPPMPKRQPVRTLSVRPRHQLQPLPQSPWHRSPACGQRNRHQLPHQRIRLLLPLKLWPRPTFNWLRQNLHLHQRSWPWHLLLLLLLWRLHRHLLP
jgi:hypothetical protein